MTTATATRIKTMRNKVTDWLVTAAWTVFLGTASALACVAVRQSFRLLQWIFVQRVGTLPSAAAMLNPGRRVLTPILGAAVAIFVPWLAQRLIPNLALENT